MGGDGIDLDDVRKRAAEIGLTNLTDKHLEQLAKADQGTQQRLGLIPTDLHAYEEPAHIFRADEEA